MTPDPLTTAVTTSTSDDLPRATDGDWGEARERTVTWHDPMIGASAAISMTGLDYLRAMAEGLLPPPPISRLMRMGLRSVEHGRVEFTCDPDESAYNPIGVVHGGLVCTLLDSVAGCALHSTLPAGRGYTSIDINVSYLKAVTSRSGTLTAVGTVVKSGSRVGFTEGVVTDEAGSVVATATSSLLVFDVA